MIRYVQKKMVRNKWLVLCLLSGLIISLAVISSIPIYTNAILQRMLIRDLESLQTTSNIYPGDYVVSMNVNKASDLDTGYETYQRVDNALQNGFVEQFDLPILASYKQYRYPNSYMNLYKTSSNYPTQQRVELYAMEGMYDHINLISGRLPENTGGDVIEVLMTESALNNLNLTLDSVVEMSCYEEDYAPLQLKVVGVFRYLDNADVYWNKTIDNYKFSFFMDFDQYDTTFAAPEMKRVDLFYWHYALDYHSLQMKDLDQLSSRLLTPPGGVDAKLCSVRFTATETMQSYMQRAESLGNMLNIVQAPTILMLLFYLFMLSSLIMEHEKNEISLLKSRGASNWQIFGNSTLQSGVIAIVALALGPLLGYGLCYVLGLSNGFMELVSRKNVKPVLISDAYINSLIATVIFLIAMLLPAISAARYSIVEYKRSKSAASKTPFWKKCFLDVLLLAVAVYCLYDYQSLSQSFTENNVETGVYIDPMLFLINTMFVLGLGMLFLRLYPYLIKLIYFIGKKLWPPTLYSSLLSVSRLRGKDQFVTLFIILTISLAIFNATAARTINTFVEDRVSYDIGADFVMQPHWQSSRSYYEMKLVEGTEDEIEYVRSDANSPGIIVERTDYLEPSMDTFKNIKGLSDGTPVFQQDEVTTTMNSQNVINLHLMGIVPDEFAKVAWFRDDLSTYHFYDYLNLLAEDPQAVLLSSSALKKGVKVGDELSLSWEGQPFAMTVTVYGFVDYWPGYNPMDEDISHLVVANFNYIRSCMRLQPYELWFNRDENVKSEEIYQDIEDKELIISEMRDESQELIEVRNDPMLQGLNGALTMGFLVTVFVCLVGFLIYWVLNLKSRTLQFGILRAMGLSKGELLGMLLWEQLFISGGAIAAGIIIGELSSSITVPLLQNLYPVAEQIPPFRVTIFAADYLRIFLVIGAMLLICILVLSILIHKLKIDQALKLGED